MIEKQLEWLYKAKADIEDDYQYICNRLWFAANASTGGGILELSEQGVSGYAPLDELITRIKQLINGAAAVESYLGTDDLETCKDCRLMILSILIAEWEAKKRNLKWKGEWK